MYSGLAGCPKISVFGRQTFSGVFHGKMPQLKIVVVTVVGVKLAKRTGRPHPHSKSRGVPCGGSISGSRLQDRCAGLPRHWHIWSS